MGERVFLKSVDVARRCTEKLYLNSKTADVHFVFGTDPAHIQEVPAHKNVLSTGSQVFNAMFYGPCKELGDILIRDASAEAFKEFLQMFYLNKVRLTSEHIADVANLCKKYEVDDGLKACEGPFKRSLTNSDMCSGLGIAILLEMSNIINFCEREIKENAEEILKTSDFLDCDRKLFNRILQLVPLKCNALTLVEASMAWPKAECERKMILPTPANLRKQLNDSISWIPFHELTKEQFELHMTTYEEFFINRDLQSIILKTMELWTKKKLMNTWTYPEEQLRRLDCDRQVANSSVYFSINVPMPYSSFFVSNRTLILTEFFIAKSSLPVDLVCLVTISTRCRFSLIEQEFVLSSDKEAHIILQKAISIDADAEYGIRFSAAVKSIGFKRKPLNQIVKLQENINIRFINDKGIVTRLVFQQSVE